ncbi:hypothetical protein JYT83_01035 [bacterium AH-315-F18]|nr:hypothetical protein [bacterium AH-315-F18]
MVEVVELEFVKCGNVNGGNVAYYYNFLDVSHHEAYTASMMLPALPNNVLPTVVA